VSDSTTFRQRVRRLVLPIYKPSRSVLLPSFPKSLLLRPMIFECWYRLRALRYVWFGGGIRTLNEFGEIVPRAAMDRVSSYNKSRIWEFFRDRTEKLIAIVHCIDAVPRTAKVLVIGPRNEAEILLLSLYGFDLGNITGLDLFTYSPLIRLGDMHDIQFPNDTFDVVFSAWTLAYSYDLKKACAEIIRVAKPGAIVATGMSHTSTQSDLDLSAITAGGVRELVDAFDPHVEHVYWQESSPVRGGEAAEVSIVFRVGKKRHVH